MSNTVGYSKLFDPVDILATSTPVYTAATITAAGVVKNISATITNTTSAGLTVTVTVAGSEFISNEVVPAYSRLAFTLPDMSNTDTITATGSNTGLVMHSTSGIVIN